MSPLNRRVTRSDTMPRTIRRTSDCVQFGGVRVLIRELPAVGELDVPGGLDHFCFCYILTTAYGPLGLPAQSSPPN